MMSTPITESEPFEDLVETETPESPHTVASPTSLPDSTPPTCHVEESKDSDTSDARCTSSDSTAPLSPDHPLTHTTPALVPSLCRTAHMVVRVPPAMSPTISDSAFCKSESEGAEDEGPTVEDEDLAAGDEGLAAGDKGPDMRVESLGLGGDEAVLEGQQWAASVVETAMGQGSGSVPEPERPERVSALRQPTLTTWIDPDDDRVYIDVPTYPQPAQLVQTPPSPEWSSGSLLVSLAPSIIPSPILSPMISLTIPSPVATPATAEAGGFLTELGARVEMQGGLIYDHTVRLGELSPALFERYDRDIGELFTRSRGIRDEIFSQRYRFRSLKHKQERVAVTFGVIWRPVLAPESWAGQTDAQRAALWHAISDTQMDNKEMQLQITEERRARLDLTEIVDIMRA
ncbi:hypothetical protein Tco_1016401 [Tanacetum coccineum]|uniref:Uncharacterized protein n=1 Tax=Tanacetum coccineum TaxID=301880 RepID=A0ABQ5FNM4_9ASTR